MATQATQTQAPRRPPSSFGGLAALLGIVLVLLLFCLLWLYGDNISLEKRIGGLAAKSAQAAASSAKNIDDWEVYAKRQNVLAAACERAKTELNSELLDTAKRADDAEAKCKPKAAATVKKVAAAKAGSSASVDKLKARADKPAAKANEPPAKVAAKPASPTSAPCIVDCAPRVTKSETSKFCGIHVVNGAGYSLTLRLGYRGGWLVVSEVGKNTDTPSDSIKAKQGDMCDTLQTAVEQTHEWRGLARKFGIPDGCTRVRVGSGTV